MSAIRFRRCRGRVAWLALLAVTAVAAGGCAKQKAPAVQRSEVQQAGPRPTPAPNLRMLVDSTPRAELLAYAHGLQFDSTPPAADVQYVPVVRGKQLVLGPHVRMEPEIGAEAITHEDLVRGRILAKFVVTGPSGALGLPVGVSYEWVDSTGGGWSELLLPEDPNVPVVRSPVRLRPGRSCPFTRIMSVDSVSRCCMWVPCSGGMCCRPYVCVAPQP